MAELKSHWTEQSLDDFLYRIAADYVRHVEGSLDSRGARANLARRLRVTPGRVSQVLNSPGNLTLRQIIKYARALGEKVSLVSYDDGDPDNRNGPIAPEVFITCWERAGKPRDFFDLSRIPEATSSYTLVVRRSATRWLIAECKSGSTDWEHRNIEVDVEGTAETGKPVPSFEGVYSMGVR